MNKLPIPIVLLALIAVACSGGTNDMFNDNATQQDAPWAAAAAAELDESIADPADDHDPSEPPYSQPVDYAATDVTMLHFGADAGYLYLRIEFTGTLPQDPVAINASGEIEAQTVTEQSCSFVIDVDNDDRTGAGARNFFGDGGMEGVDIFFGTGYRYGGPVEAHSNYDFQGGDIHLHQGQVIGEYGAGGPGHDFLLVRFPIATLGSTFWPVGSTVEVGGWCEAESNLYHEFSNDFLVPRSWTVPQS